MGGLAYFTTRHFLLAERETAAQTQAFANAFSLRSQLAAGSKKYGTLLASLDSASNSHSILVRDSMPYYPTTAISQSPKPAVTESSIPAALRAEISRGNAAIQTYISGPKN